MPEQAHVPGALRTQLVPDGGDRRVAPVHVDDVGTKARDVSVIREADRRIVRRLHEGTSQDRVPRRGTEGHPRCRRTREGQSAQRGDEHVGRQNDMHVPGDTGGGDEGTELLLGGLELQGLEAELDAFWREAGRRDEGGHHPGAGGVHTLRGHEQALDVRDALALRALHSRASEHLVEGDRAPARRRARRPAEQLEPARHAAHPVLREHRECAVDVGEILDARDPDARPPRRAASVSGSTGTTRAQGGSRYTPTSASRRDRRGLPELARELGHPVLADHGSLAETRTPRQPRDAARSASTSRDLPLNPPVCMTRLPAGSGIFSPPRASSRCTSAKLVASTMARPDGSRARDPRAQARRHRARHGGRRYVAGDGVAAQRSANVVFMCASDESGASSAEGPITSTGAGTAQAGRQHRAAVGEGRAVVGANVSHRVGAARADRGAARPEGHAAACAGSNANTGASLNASVGTAGASEARRDRAGIETSRRAEPDA